LAPIGDGYVFLPGYGSYGGAVFRKGGAVPTEGVVRYRGGTAVVVDGADGQAGGAEGFAYSIGGFGGQAGYGD
jgi:hypothetical protein